MLKLVVGVDVEDGHRGGRQSVSTRVVVVGLVSKMVVGDDCWSRPLEVSVREDPGWRLSLKLVVGSNRILEEGIKRSM